MAGIAVSDAVSSRGGATSTVRLKRLTARDFRNLAHVVLDVPPGGLALVGDNGHGKTNILESIYYLHLFRSMRGARDAELVRFGAAGFHVAAMADGARYDVVAAGFEREPQRRRVMLDGVACTRLSDALGAIPAVVFAPADVAVIAGAPSARRQYLDVLLASVSRSYLTSLRDYRTALAQRNATLRAGAGRAQVVAWEPQLALHGAAVRRERAAFVDWAGQRFAALGERLAEGEALSLRYRTSVSVGAGASEAEFSEALLRGLTESRDRDMERGLTHIGPHRDDLDLRLGGVPLRRYGSAGQQRSAAIGLRLLECEWSRERGGLDPVLLLDDPVAELDRGRAARVLDVLTSRGMGQVLLAVPREEDIPEALSSLARCRVRDGAVTVEGTHA